MTTYVKPAEISPETSSSLIDVRSPDEYIREHIPGSVNIPLERLAESASGLREKAEIVLTCRSGKRALEARNILEGMGCHNIKILEGGLLGWKAAHLPTRSLRKGYSIMQQVQMVVGLMILIGWFVRPLWFLVPLAGIGMLTAGLTNTCMMAVFLSKMPWNRTDNLSCNTNTCHI